MRVRARAGMLALTVLAWSVPAAAQERRARGEREQAELMLERGALVSAESVYYTAVRTRPRDPAARFNLGHHLLNRGAGKVAAALLEEAKFFGGSAADISADLLAAYERAGMWRAIAGYAGTALAPGDKARAEYLMAHPPATLGADSAVLVIAPGEVTTLGRLALVIGGDSVSALIDPTVRGVVLDGASARRRGVRLFSREAGALRVGVVDSLRLGTLTLANVPVRIGSGDSAAARVGLDWLGDLTPTFDLPNRMLMVRRASVDARTVRGARVPIVYTADGWGLVLDGFAPLSTEAARTSLGDRRWTLLTAKGEIAVHAAR